MQRNDLPHKLSPKGRGSIDRPANRFMSVQAVPDWEHFENDDDIADEMREVPSEFHDDDSRSVVTENNSPDIPFRYSLNPYRGCEHGCAYCYARPTHEYLGLNAGIDFESKIFVKQRAPALFRDFLSRNSWRPQLIMLSGVTDCYQPAERRYRLTRGCLEVALAARQPISVITKNALILRDLDLLRELAARRLVHAAISITTLDEALARSMEPRTSRPAARLRAVRELSLAGVPVRAMLAPIIPGLNDHEVPSLLQAVSEAGALGAGFVLLRLPLTVAPVFREWLNRTRPSHVARIENLVRATRQGKWNSSQFGARMRGSGPIAEQIEQSFRVFSKKHRLDGPLPEFDFEQFVPPLDGVGQKRLF